MHWVGGLQSMRMIGVARACLVFSTPSLTVHKMAHSAECAVTRSEISEHAYKRIKAEQFQNYGGRFGRFLRFRE
jgi:hypothetical protein